MALGDEHAIRGALSQTRAHDGPGSTISRTGSVATPPGVGVASGVGALLDGYSADWGTAARRLAVHHHAAQLHAAELVEIYRSVADPPVRATSTSGVALLAAERLHWEARAVAAEWEVARLRRELADLSRIARWLRRPVGAVTRAARKLLRRG